jgi:hypothetical protein
VPADGFAACPALRSLDLSGVRGLALPDGLFAATPQLEVLRVASAGLTALPAAVLAACSLRELDLSRNSLAVMPEAVTGLTRCGLCAVHVCCQHDVSRVRC